MRSIINQVRCRVAGAVLIAAPLLSGCATPTVISEHLPPPPALELGPEFEALHAEWRAYRVGNGILDSAGRAHLIISMPEKTQADGDARPAPREVRHIVIGPHGVESGEIIRSGVVVPEPDDDEQRLRFRESIDLAFDRAGNLHALINGEHLMLKDGAWTGPLRTPWQEANLGPGRWWNSQMGFVKGAPDLTWYFYLFGSDMGVPKSLTLKATGGVGGAGGMVGMVIIPYPGLDDEGRLVVVPEETPYRHWYALDMESGSHPSQPDLTENAQRVIHARYETISASLFSNDLDEWNYAAFVAGGNCPTPNPEAWHQKQKLALKLANGTPICPINGSPVVPESKFLPQEFSLTPTQKTGPQILVDEDVGSAFSNDSFAVEPESGITLMVDQDGTSLLAGAEPKARAAAMPIKNADVLLAPAGKGRFHALVAGRGDYPMGDDPVYYLEYANNAWTAPVEIGKYWSADRADYIARPQHTIAWYFPDGSRIVSGGDGRALLIWPREHALVARWVTLK